MNKLGISPLIATVLLLAFAVATGTIAVSYVLDFAKPDPCSDVGIAVQSVCQGSEAVTFIIENTGNEPLIGVQARFVNANKDIKENAMALALLPATASSASLPYTTLNPAGVTLTLTPKIKHDTEEMFCSNKQVMTKLGTC